MATVVIQKREREEGSSYVITYKDPDSGRKRYFKTFRKAKEAQQAANDLRYLIDNGKVAAAQKDRRKSKPLTTGQVCEQLEEHWRGQAKNDALSTVTLNGYLVRTGQICKVFGDRILCEITPEEVGKYRDKIAEATSNVNANRITFVFKQVFAFGEKVGAITGNPASGVKMLSERAHERNSYLMPDELGRVVQACQQVNAKYYLPAIILLGAEHGASKQEILSLRWQDINFDYQGKGLIRFFRTKNQRERTETIMPQTKAALLAWKGHLDEMREKRDIALKDTSYVFCRLDGTRIAGFTSSWRKVRGLAGFDKVHFHDLRHTFCSNLMLVGADIKDVKDMIGHRDLKMTDRYTHLMSVRKTLLQEKLADHFEGAFPVGKAGGVGLKGGAATGEHIGNI